MKIAILGTAGVPAAYGGFETLADNLCQYRERESLSVNLSVYCSTKNTEHRPKRYFGAALHYIPISANGAQSIIYDAVCFVHAIASRNDTIILLGVSGALLLPISTVLPGLTVITNVDGIEWRREKWKGMAKKILKILEWMAVKYSDAIVSDNEEIRNYIRSRYGVASHVIEYGGDHALAVDDTTEGCRNDRISLGIEDGYALALCRIEPENNCHTILEAYSRKPEKKLVFVGNWRASDYGQKLFEAYGGYENITLLNPIYDTSILKEIRERCDMYVHGHSAGGTNPSLVEMMHFGKPIVAFNCKYNEYSTEGNAIFFNTAEDLAEILSSDFPEGREDIGRRCLEVARRKYTWNIIGKKYFDMASQQNIGAANLAKTE